MLGSRPLAPVSAQAGALLGGRTGRMGGSSAGSIIWPMAPSATTMTMVRYLSARSKASTTQVDRLLHGGRGQDDHVEVAVPGALDRLEVVALRGLDVAQARPAAHDVDDDRRHLGAAM